MFFSQYLFRLKIDLLALSLYLLSSLRSVDLNQPDTMGRTSLMWTCYQGTSPECLHYLLKAPGIDVERTDSTGYTALHWAVISSHMDYARALVEKGAAWDRRDPQGKTPVSFCIYRLRFKLIFSLLR